MRVGEETRSVSGFQDRPLIRHDLRSCPLPLLAFGHFPLIGGIGSLTRGVGPLEGGRLGRAAQCAAPTGEAEHSVAGG